MATVIQAVSPLLGTGAGAAAVIGGQTTNEEGWLLQRVMRQALGSPHVDSRKGGPLALSAARRLSHPDLAAALPELDYDCGLGTSSLFTADVASPALAPRGGMLPVGRIAPDAALLDEHAAPADRRDWWLERIARCYDLLAD